MPWNFAKFIVDGSTGLVVSYYNPRISPLSLRTEIEAMLSKGTPYEPKEVPYGLGGTSPLSDNELANVGTSSGCVVNVNDNKAPAIVAADHDNKV